MNPSKVSVGLSIVAKKRNLFVGLELKERTHISPLSLSYLFSSISLLSLGPEGHFPLAARLQFDLHLSAIIIMWLSLIGTNMKEFAFLIDFWMSTMQLVI